MKRRKRGGREEGRGERGNSFQLLNLEKRKDQKRGRQRERKEGETQ